MIAGALEIQLVADVARIRKDMADAKGVVTSTMDGIESAVGAATKVLGVLGIGLSVNYFKNFVLGAINAQDKLLEMSQKVGVSIETLAGLEHAANMSGVSLDGVQKALKTVSTGLFEADKGVKSSQANFSALGISIHDMSGDLKSADAVLIEAAEKFAAMEDGTTKTALATKLFGRAGLDLIPMLNAGSEGLAALIAEGQRFNPVTAQSAAQADIFKDNLDRLKGSASSFGVSLANFLLPHLSKLSEIVVDFTNSNKMAELLDKIKLAAELLAMVFIARMVPAIVASGVAFVAAAAESIAYQAALARMAGVSTTAAIAQGALSAATGLFSGALAVIGGPVGAAILATYAIYKLVGALAESNKEFRESQTAMREYVKTGATLVSMQERIAAGQKLVANATDEEKESIKEATTYVHGLFRSMGMVVPATVAVTTAVQAATVTVYKYGETVKFAVEAQDAHVKAFEDNVKAQQEFEEASLNAQRRVNDTIEGLKNEQQALGMTERAQRIFNAVTEASANNALPAQIAKIAQLEAINYDLAESSKVTAAAETTAAAQRTKAVEDEAQRARDNWGRTHEYLATTFIDIANNGGNAFDNIAKAFSAMIQRMLAEWAASKLMNIFGMSGGPAPGGSGAGSVLASVGSSVVRSVMSGGTAAAPGGVAATMGTASTIGSTVAGVGSTIAGGVSAAGSAIASGASNLVALAAANPVTAAIIAAAAVAAALSKDETLSGNSGFLIRDLAGGGGGRTFDVEAFESGFDPVGFARREDRAEAVAVIDSFRALDSVLTRIAEGAGLTVDYNSNNFGGFNEKGQGNGLFFGTANEDGDASNVSLADQQTQFVRQWLTGLSGQVDQSLINQALAGSSAIDMINIAGGIAGIAIPAFASGGYHSGGLMMVGETGPELVNTGPARVFNNADTLAALNSNSDVLLSKILGELSEMRRIAMASFNLLDKWDNDPLTVVVAA